MDEERPIPPNLRDEEALDGWRAWISEELSKGPVSSSFFLEVFASLYLYMRMIQRYEEVISNTALFVAKCEAWIAEKETSTIAIGGETFEVPYRSFEEGGLELMGGIAADLHKLVTGEQ